MSSSVGPSVLNEALSAFVEAPVSFEELQQYRPGFEAVDVNGDGHISGEELHRALEADQGHFSLDVAKGLINSFVHGFTSEHDERGVNLHQFVHLYRFLAAMSELFLAADEDGSGSIEAPEVHASLAKEGLDLELELVQHLVLTLEKASGDEAEKGLRLDGFVMLRLLIGQARTSFDLADVQRDGFLTKQEAIDSMATGGDEAAVRALFEEFDVDHDGKLSWPEYLRIAFTVLADLQ